MKMEVMCLMHGRAETTQDNTGGQRQRRITKRRKAREGRPVKKRVSLPVHSRLPRAASSAASALTAGPALNVHQEAGWVRGKREAASARYRRQVKAPAKILHQSTSGSLPPDAAFTAPSGSDSFSCPAFRVPLSD
ncbi:uncharacterized protein LOC123514265 [Portunus trituberculatus]|uniref:uncharacterized protein LOC123514265 n=1 Tax=Portunus trituberculatus TaxID=210409 RepID=UPI001E1D0FC5|nr:uncharacterized protein LOC123514265 [Portunus trituberculatus]